MASLAGASGITCILSSMAARFCFLPRASESSSNDSSSGRSRPWAWGIPELLLLLLLLLLPLVLPPSAAVKGRPGASAASRELSVDMAWTLRFRACCSASC